jgi:type II secretory pathway pseudopilin PulG
MFPLAMRAGRRGFSVVQVLVALAMVTVLAGAIALTVLNKLAEAKLQRAAQEIATLEQAAASWIQRTGKTSYTALDSIATLVQSGAAPARFADPAANPWGGGYTIVGSGEAFSITVEQAPSQACTTLAGIFGSRALIQCPQSFPGQIVLVFGEASQAQSSVQVGLFAAGGTVSGPFGISCGPNGTGSCVATVALGSTLTLTATADSGYTLSGWTGCDSVSGAQCTLTVTGARTVLPQFTVLGSTVTVTAPSQGTVTGPGISCPGDCAEFYPVGTPVTLTATAAPGYVLSGWTGCDGTNGTQCTLTVTGPRTVAATFVPAFALSVTVAGGGSGTVTSSPGGIACPGDCSETYASGTTVTLTAQAGANSLFTGWSGACSGSSPTCQVSMTSAQSVTATFEPGETLTVTVDGPGSVQGQ